MSLKGHICGSYDFLKATFKSKRKNREQTIFKICFTFEKELVAATQYMSKQIVY